MKLYNVEVEGVLVIAADSEEEATAKVRDLIGANISSELSYRPSELTNLAMLRNEWDWYCLPYGTEEEKTVGQILEQLSGECR